MRGTGGLGTGGLQWNPSECPTVSWCLGRAQLWVPGTALDKPGLSWRGSGLLPSSCCPHTTARRRSCGQKCPNSGQAGAGSAQLSSRIYGRGFGSSQLWRGAISLSSVYKTQ